MIDDPEIDWLRQEIDSIDRELLGLVRKRVDKVLAVGALKKKKGLAIHDPAREASLLDRLSQGASDPLDASLVRAVFETLVRECRRIETERQ